MTRQRAGYDEKTWNEALDWLFRVNDDPNGPGTAAGLRSWLEEADSHAQAFAEARRLWALTGQMQSACAKRWQGPDGPANRRVGVAPERPPRYQRPGAGNNLGGTDAAARRGRRRGLAAAALVACVSLVAVSGVWHRFDAEYATGVDEIRLVALEDGSRVRLGPQSGLDVASGASGQTVELLRGAAFFEVAQAVDRPFVVRAGTVRVEVTGTAFEVQRHRSALSVAVREGHVQVGLSGSGSGAGNQDLSQGEYLRMDLTTGATRRGAVSTAQVAAWLRGRLLVNQWTVRDAIDTIGRHRSGYILITDDRLAAKPISGVYDLNNPIGAIRAVVEPYGGGVTEITPYLLIVSSD